jgi:NAD(P)-dependent dehydrogenase (short-subunit alcohol dehydrogenase family)
MDLVDRVILVAGGSGLLGTAIARAHDVADQVVAFCRSDSVTGQVLNIDAGVFFH